MTTKALIGQLQFNAASTSTPLDSLRWNTLVLFLQAAETAKFYETPVDGESEIDPKLVAALESAYETLLGLYASLEAAS